MSRYDDRHRIRANRIQRRNRARLNEYKESHPCVDCGGFFPYYVMQFDHREDKAFKIADRSGSYGSAALEAEIAKCDLVCGNCHAIRTHERRRVGKDVAEANGHPTLF